VIYAHIKSEPWHLNSAIDYNTILTVPYAIGLDKELRTVGLPVTNFESNIPIENTY